MSQTAGEVLVRLLGLEVVYGVPLPGLPVVDVTDPEVAWLMAQAHHRVHRAPAAAHVGDGVLRLRPSGPSERIAGNLAVFALATRVPGTIEVRGDLRRPMPDVVPAPLAPLGVAAPVEVPSADNPIVLAGPGVLDAVPGLHALATSANLGVLNTWGAKGVFDWRSRHHLATIGLQAGDFALGGLDRADLIIAVGVDELEAPRARWPDVPVLIVDPAGLGALAEEWSRPRGDIAIPALRARLADVTQRGWARSAAPLAPSRVTRHYGQCFGVGGLVAADAGAAGYWVARTFSTTRLGSAQVPAARIDGFAAAAALVARLRSPGRPVLAVVDGPVSELTERVVATGERLGVRVPVEAWDPAGPALDADAHLGRLQHLGGGIVSIATDPAQMDEMIEAAGEVIAWT